MIRIASLSSPSPVFPKSCCCNRMGHKNDSRVNRTDQLVTLFSINIAVLNGDCKGIVERKTGESEVDAVFGAIDPVLAFVPVKTHSVYTFQCIPCRRRGAWSNPVIIHHIDLGTFQPCMFIADGSYVANIAHVAYNRKRGAWSKHEKRNGESRASVAGS